MVGYGNPVRSNGADALKTAAVAARTHPDDDRRAYWKVLTIEAAIGAAANSLVGNGVAWFVFGGLVSIPVWGSHGLVVDTAMSTFLPVLVMALVLPVIVAGRVARGNFDAIFPLVGWVRSPWLARRPLLRAPLIALGATTMTLLIVVSLLELVTDATIAPATLAVIKGAQNAMLGALFAPLIVALSLSDAHSLHDPIFRMPA